MCVCVCVCVHMCVCVCVCVELEYRLTDHLGKTDKICWALLVN